MIKYFAEIIVKSSPAQKSDRHGEEQPVPTRFGKAISNRASQNRDYL